MGRPALFGSPAREPLILLKPFLNVRQSSVAYRRLRRCLTLILTNILRWLLLKELGDSVGREPKVSGRWPLGLCRAEELGAKLMEDVMRFRLVFITTCRNVFR